MDNLPAIEERLRNHDQRITANHDSIGTLRERWASQDAKIQVLGTELRETREDIAEMKVSVNGSIERLETKLDTELASIRRNSWAILFAVISLTIGVVSVAVQLVAF